MANTVSRTISDDTLNRIIQIESAGNPNAKAPTSSAAGLGQFINATWLATLRKHQPHQLVGARESDALSWRVGKDTAALQLEMLARFTEDNARGLGPGYQDGDLYLAHFLGLGAARAVLRAPPETPVAQVVTAAAIAANKSILSGKTCGQVRQWAQQSMINRWAKAGRPDWVKKYADPHAIKPQTEDALKQAPADPGKAAGGAAAGGAVVIGTGAAIEAGWSWGEIAAVIFVLLALGGAAFFAWRWWRARQQDRAGDAGLMAVAEALESPAAGEAPTEVKTAVATPASQRGASRPRKRAPPVKRGRKSKKPAKKRRAVR